MVRKLGRSADDLALFHDPGAVEAFDGGLLDGSLGSDGEADDAEQAAGDGLDDAEGRVTETDHVLIFTREGGERCFEEKVVGRKGGLGERRIFDEADDFAGGIIDDEFGAITSNLGEELAL